MITNNVVRPSANLRNFAKQIAFEVCAGICAQEHRVGVVGKPAIAQDTGCRARCLAGSRFGQKLVAEIVLDD